LPSGINLIAGLGIFEEAPPSVEGAFVGSAIIRMLFIIVAVSVIHELRQVQLKQREAWKGSMHACRLKHMYARTTFRAEHAFS